MSRAAARVAALIAVACAALALPSSAPAEPALPPHFQDEVVFDEIEQPVNFRFAPDGRVFVATKAGEILVYENLEDQTPTVFADLRGDVYDNGDRGLLGIELDPEFETGRPYVYALYTWSHVLGEAWDPENPRYGTPGVSGDPPCPSQNSSGSCLVSGRLVRLTENSQKRNHAVEEGGRPREEELLQGWCQQFSSHSIGELGFGPEGALYVSGGEGASFESTPDYGQLGTPPNPCGDPPTAAGVAPTEAQRAEAQGGALRAQNLNLLNGAILRVDPNTGAPFPGNPLAGQGNANAERTIAKGFRNPFRFTFDPATGELYTGNVGSTQIEEIDRFQAPPATLYNSGWPCYEGLVHQFQFKLLGLDTCSGFYQAEQQGEPQTATPFFAYSHRQSVVPEDECPSEAGSAIGGISFYEGSDYPAKYKGALFFADPVRGCMWVMYPGADGRPDPSTTQRFMREGRIYPGVKIAEGPEGDLFYADLLGEEGLGEGSIHRISFSETAPVARLEAGPKFGSYDSGGNFETTLDASKSSDPNQAAASLTYEWDLNEDGNFESSGGSTRTVTYTKAEEALRMSAGETPNRVIALRVEDAEGNSSVSRITVYPGDTPPQPTITEPAAGFEWGVGDEISLNASAIDFEGHEVTAPLLFYWTTRMAHCPDLAHPTQCHVHPLQTFSGIRHPKFTAPQHEYPSYLEAVLRVSDWRGLSGTASVKLQPRTVGVPLASEPPGIPLAAGSFEEPAPFQATAIDGSEIELSAPATYELGGTEYEFEKWSDGGAIGHTVLAGPGAPEYVASYVEAPPQEEPGGGEEPGGEEPGGGGSGSGGGSAGGGADGASSPPPPALQGPPAPAVSPRTRLGAHPAARTTKTSALFTFSADVRGASFRCKLDGKAWAACISPKRYRGLRPGRHVFAARAEAGGRGDPTPARFAWKVLPPAG